MTCEPCRSAASEVWPGLRHAGGSQLVLAKIVVGDDTSAMILDGASGTVTICKGQGLLDAVRGSPESVDTSKWLMLPVRAFR